MTLVLRPEDWRALFPRAPEPVIDAFARDRRWLAQAGLTQSPARLAYALANVEHECAGFSIPDLTENIHYTAARLAAVFPRRFADAAAVRARFGTKPGWQTLAFDDIYGQRMGNRPGSRDGSTYIGRGGPQITGRGAYRALAGVTGLDLEDRPGLACLPEHQPALLAGFWIWKGLNARADAGDFLGTVKAWNGGTNGLADRKALLAGNDPVIARLRNVQNLADRLRALLAAVLPG